MLWGEGGTGLPPATHPGQEPSHSPECFWRREGLPVFVVLTVFTIESLARSFQIDYIQYLKTQTELPFKCNDQRPLVFIIRDTVLTFQIIASHRAVSTRRKWKRKGQVGIKSAWRHMPQVEDIAVKDGCWGWSFDCFIQWAWVSRQIGWWLFRGTQGRGALNLRLELSKAEERTELHRFPA